MTKFSTRKLFLFGKYSLSLLLPKKWLQELGIEIGDNAYLEFDRKKKRIIVRFGEENAKSKKDKKDSDWQPIPQL